MADNSTRARLYAEWRTRLGSSSAAPPPESLRSSACSGVACAASDGLQARSGGGVLAPPSATGRGEACSSATATRAQGHLGHLVTSLKHAAEVPSRAGLCMRLCTGFFFF